MKNTKDDSILDKGTEPVSTLSASWMKDISTDKKSTWWQRFSSGLNEFYHAPYRQTMARAARDEEDFFMLLMFSESLGIDNPASFYTLELQPLFLENFHEWHTRMGMDRCPFDHVGCC